MIVPYLPMPCSRVCCTQFQHSACRLNGARDWCFSGSIFGHAGLVADERRGRALGMVAVTLAFV